MPCVIFFYRWCTTNVHQLTYESIQFAHTTPLQNLPILKRNGKRGDVIIHLDFTPDQSRMVMDHRTSCYGKRASLANLIRIGKVDYIKYNWNFRRNNHLNHPNVNLYHHCSIQTFIPRVLSVLAF